MKINFAYLSAISLVACFTLCSWAGEEEDLIRVLKGNSGAVQKCSACQRLRIVGTSQSVSALSELLLDERVSHAARYALEGMQYPEATVALRTAMQKAAGLTKVGLIDSLGWKRDRDSASLIIPLLEGSDVSLATAAASALGKIATKDAVEALSSKRDTVSAAAQPVVLDSLLKCAEFNLSTGETTTAFTIYQNLFDGKYSFYVRAAAWRGMVLSDADHRSDRLIKALAHSEGLLRASAIKVLEELNDPQALRECIKQWTTLPSDSQLALLRAGMRLGTEMLPTIQQASTHSDVSIRIAAWRALAGMEDSGNVPALAKAAARGEPGEREVARETLLRIRGVNNSNPVLACLNEAASDEKVELMRALGGRGEQFAADTLLQYADSSTGQVQLAALDALSRLAVPKTFAPLLEMVSKSNSQAVQNALLKALRAVCRTSIDKEKDSKHLVDIMDKASTPVRRLLMPLLAELGTPATLMAAQNATKSSDSELALEGVRVLSQWPDASPAGWLLELAKKKEDIAFHALALRGCIEIVGLESDAAKRLGILQQAFSAARRVDEKRQALGQIGQIPLPIALHQALAAMQESNLLNEASMAVISIAELLSKLNPDLANEAAGKVLAQCKTPEITRRALLLRHKPKSGGPFIQDWLVCGPFEKAGVTGANAVFTTPFGPEIAQNKVQWQPVQKGDTINLAVLFPGKENCAAFLKTEIIVAEDCNAALLLGSDDGAKVWLNGVVVHNNNVDRGQVVDQDIVPINLNKGPNNLLLKISQGGGGWSVCARIVGADGMPIPGLKVQVSK